MLRRDLDLRAREVARENRFGLGHGLDGEEPLAQLRAPAQSLGVPAEVLAEFERGLARVALNAQRETRVLERRREPLFRSWIGAFRASLEQIARLVEEPRIPEGAAGDHDA